MRYFTTMEDMSEENFPHTAVPAHDESLQQPATHAQVASQITDNIVDAEVAPQSQGTPALDIRSLVKIFDQRAVVDGINLTVPRGSFYGLVGRNGAGKTTSLSLWLPVCSNLPRARCSLAGQISGRSRWTLNVR